MQQKNGRFCRFRAKNIQLKEKKRLIIHNKFLTINYQIKAAVLQLLFSRFHILQKFYNFYVTMINNFTRLLIF